MEASLFFAFAITLDMKIDAHQHFWYYEPVEFSWIVDDARYLRRDFLPPDLEPELEKFGFDGCVAVQAPQRNEETNFLLQLADEHPFIKGVVGWVDLQAKDLEKQLETWQGKEKLKGFRHIVQAETDNNFINKKDFKEGVKTLGKKGFAYDILIYPVQLPAATTFCRELNSQKLVIDHIAKPYIAWQEKEPWASQIKAFAGLDHVYCKLSGMVTEADWKRWRAKDFDFYMDTVLETFGPKRLMFGSDWPVCQAAATFSQTYELVHRYVAKLSTDEQAAIFGQTAVAFYNLK